MQGRCTILVSGIDICAFLDEQFDGFDLTEKSRP